jgi:CheY-like chemotaxis protein
VEGPRILLVEDNAVNQRVAKLMMEKRGYTVDVAADGQEAIEATQRTAYAAVLMDCHMPRCDGYAATLEIRRRDAHRPRVPIIAMTANAGPGARERCLASGMDDYIAKPVTAETLDEVLRRWVRPAAGGPAPLPPPPPRPRIASSPAIDLGMLRNLRTTQAAGEPDIVAEVIALFLRDAPARVAAIRDGVALGDLDGAARTAHTLKGSAGHLGAKTLAALCARFEEKVRAGAPFNVTFAVSAIADELERVRAALAAEAPGTRRGAPPQSTA